MITCLHHLLKTEQTQSSETSAFNTQTPGKYPEDNLSQLLILFHTGVVGLCLHELRRLKGPTFHPTRSQINLDHRWNESNMGTSKVPAVLRRKTYCSATLSAVEPTCTALLGVRASTLRRRRSAD
jgi:hypothetical protein